MSAPIPPSSMPFSQQIDTDVGCFLRSTLAIVSAIMALQHSSSLGYALTNLGRNRVQPIACIDPETETFSEICSRLAPVQLVSVVAYLVGLLVKERRAIILLKREIGNKIKHVSRLFFCIFFYHKKLARKGVTALPRQSTQPLNQETIKLTRLSRQQRVSETHTIT